MKIEAFNERIEEEINQAYNGVLGEDKNYNRKREKVFKYYINNMLKRTLNMFEYKNLPETLSPIQLEKYLQGSGACLICEVKAEQITNPEAKPGIYVLPCKAGGRLNANYVPTRAVVANAWLGFSAEYNLEEKEAIYCWNDSLREGFGKMFSLYASELADNVLTLHFQEVHNRILTIIKASTEDERKDAIQFYKDYEDGEFASLLNEDFLENIRNDRVDPFKGSSNTSIKDTLEARQWLIAHWNIEIALNDNYNMKRESLNENEIEANADTLTPLLDDAYKFRKKLIQELNEQYKGLYGFEGNASVEFASSWKRVHKREENAEKQEELEIEALEKTVENPTEETTQEAPTETPEEPKEDNKDE